MLAGSRVETQVMRQGYSKDSSFGFELFSFRCHNLCAPLLYQLLLVTSTSQRAKVCLNSLGCILKDAFVDNIRDSAVPLRRLLRMRSRDAAPQAVIWRTHLICPSRPSIFHRAQQADEDYSGRRQLSQHRGRVDF